MIRQLTVLLALVAFVVLSALPASATCVPGRVVVDPKSKTIVVEPPRCHPFE